jgi:hypothetical protein
MAQLHRSKATLRIVSDSLVPDVVTDALGHAPDEAQVKGQEFAGRASGKSRVAKFGMWRLAAPEARPGDVDTQIKSILGKLTSDLSVWRRLAAESEMDMFCGLFMQQENEGLNLSAEALAMLGERGIELSLDIYDGRDENQDA